MKVLAAGFAAVSQWLLLMFMPRRECNTCRTIIAVVPVLHPTLRHRRSGIQPAVAIVHFSIIADAAATQTLPVAFRVAAPQYLLARVTHLHKPQHARSCMWVQQHASCRLKQHLAMSACWAIAGLVQCPRQRVRLGSSQALAPGCRCQAAPSAARRATWRESADSAEVAALALPSCRS